MDEENIDILLLDEEDGPILIEEECAELRPILKEFVEYYAANKDKPVEDWLSKKLQEQLPEKEPKEIMGLTNEIITTLRVDERNQKSLSEAVSNGRSKESWFASSVHNTASRVSTEKMVNYLEYLDKIVREANTKIVEACKTQAKVVNKNPNLDGFIAEQYHAQTFNMNAEITGSPYRAKVLEPKGKRYKKNSVDIAVFDKRNDKIVGRYQSKCCKDAKATAKAFEHGDYRGQRKLVPEGQEGVIQKKVTTVIEAPDGTTSNPLTKSRAEQMRDEIQSGTNELNLNKLNYNEYAIKNLASEIGKQAGYAALQGAAVGVGFDIAQKLYNGEKIEGEEVVEAALESGADFGIKAAAAGALKVGVEKEIITVLPKSIEVGTLANIAHVAIEDAKVVGKMISGELSFKEAAEKIEQTTVSTAAGLFTMGKGAAAVGTAAGLMFGPVGVAVGGFVGGTVGYMAGAKVGETIVKGAQKVKEKVVEHAKAAWEGAKDWGNRAWEGAKGIVGGIASFFGF